MFTSSPIDVAISCCSKHRTNSAVKFCSILFKDITFKDTANSLQISKSWLSRIRGKTEALLLLLLLSLIEIQNFKPTTVIILFDSKSWWSIMKNYQSSLLWSIWPYSFIISCKCSRSNHSLLPRNPAIEGLENTINSPSRARPPNNFCRVSASENGFFEAVFQNVQAAISKTWVLHYTAIGLTIEWFNSILFTICAAKIN